MNKVVRKLLPALVICLIISGCGSFGNKNSEQSIIEHESAASEAADPGADKTEESETAEAEESGAAEAEKSDVSEAEESDAAEAEESEATEEDPEGAEAVDPEPQYENISNNEEGHYTFQPHVFGSRYLEEFGESYRDAFFAYCDALRNGEDTFACPDQNTLDWCVGRLSNFFFPVARNNVTSGVCKNGVAKLIFLIPHEEFMEKEKAFEEDIVNILNDCLSDDYTQLEKMIALYEYMTTQYVYDYEMYAHSLEWMDLQSPYRCLTEKTGICCELAGLYNYLLLQVGIDSEEMGGTVHFSEDFAEGHSWVFVTLNGKSYHIDPTYGLTTVLPPLSYFMMTDQLREERDGFAPAEYTLGAKGDESRDFFTFEATSEDFSEMWDGSYLGLDRDSKEILYEDWMGEIHRFSYAEFDQAA